MQLPSHTDALADHKNAAGAAKHFAEGEEGARLEQLKEDRRARPTNAQLMDAMSYWTEDDLLAICQARRKCDPLLLARVVNAAINRELDKVVQLEFDEDDELVAHARLIAGAPKMYDALREIVISLCALVENPANPDFMLALGSSNLADNDELKSALEAARAAIAEAEGQS